MNKKELAAIPPRLATDEEMQRFSLSDQKCYFLHAGKHSETLLVLSIYNAADEAIGHRLPEFIVYCGKGDYINRLYDLGLEKYVWRTGSLDKHFAYDENVSLLDEASRQAIASFMGSTAPFMRAIWQLQYNIISDRIEARWNRIKQEIDGVMALIPEPPTGFKEYVGSKSMPMRYLYYDSGRKSLRTGFCTNCRQTVAVDAPKHSTEGTCPVCHAAVEYKSRGRFKHGLYDQSFVCLPQKIKGGFVIRCFDAWRYEKPDEERVVKYRECYRIVYRDQAVTHYVWGNFRQTGEVRWCDSRDALFPNEQHVYPVRLNRLTAGTMWQYGCYQAYQRQVGAIRMSQYFAQFHTHPYIETLLKINMNTLARELVTGHRAPLDTNRKKTRIHEALQISKRGFQILREMDAGIDQVRIAQQLEAVGIQQYDADLIDAIRAGWHNNASMFIRHVLPHTTFMKASRYTKKLTWIQRNDWLDYLQMAAEVGYDMREEHAMFPKDLKEAHDAVIPLHRELVRKNTKKSFEPYAKLAKRYEWTEDGSPYMITAPQAAIDIVDEGLKLNHCVHNYVKKVMTRKCHILFLRRTIEPNKPYVTIEIQGREVRQFRGVNNKQPDEATCDFVKDYRDWLAGGMRQPRANERGAMAA